MKKLILLIAIGLSACTTVEKFRGVAAYDVVVCPSEARRAIPKDFIPLDKTKIKVAFFDADSTLRVSKEKGKFFPIAWDDVVLLPHMGPHLRKLEKENYLIYIVSNQGGVAAKNVSCDTAERAIQYVIELAKSDGGVIHAYDFAENYDDSRKPGIGMALKLELVLKHVFGEQAAIDKSASIMVGDSAFEKTDLKKLGPDGNWIEAFPGEEGVVPGTHHGNADRLFAKNYGIRFYEAAVFFGWRKNGIDVFESKEAVEDYLKKYP